MGGNAQHLRTSIASAICLTLGMALAVALGAVPRVVGTTAGAAHHVVSPTAVVHKAAHIRQSALITPAVVAPEVKSGTPKTVPADNISAPATTVPVTTAPATTVPVAKQPVAHLKAPVHHKKKHHKKKHHKPAPPKKAARVTPSASAVADAVHGLGQYVHTILTPTAAQVAQFGDQVCTAFDQNQTLAQIESVILAKVKQLPFTTVSSGAADYVVKTAVHLYCPGYASKLA